MQEKQTYLQKFLQTADVVSDYTQKQKNKEKNKHNIYIYIYIYTHTKEEN